MQDAALADPPYGTLEHGLDAAQAILARGDLAGAMATFAAVRAQFPDAPLGWQRASFAQLQASHFDEADALLDAAFARFPSNIGIAVDRAWVAHRRRDGAAAMRRWAHVRATFPTYHIGYTGAATTAREGGDLDAASSLLAEAAMLFPDEPTLATEQAWLALARRDFAASIEHWHHVRARQPENWLGYTGGAAALREAGRLDEADALLRDAIARFPEAPAPLLDHAHLATIQRDWRQSLQRWQLAAARLPDRVEPYTGQALALREAQRFDEADAVLTAALGRFPSNGHIAIDHAWIAQFRRDWPSASQRWARVREMVPDFVPGYVNGAVALREGGQIEAAEALLATAMLRFPTNAEPTLEHARFAQARRDWPMAAIRWEQARIRFPDAWPVYVGLAICHREQGSIPQAEGVLRAAVDRFPAQPEPLTDLGWFMTHQHRHDEALRLWEQMRTRFPSFPVGYTGAAVALRDARRFDAARDMLARATDRFPDDPAPQAETGWLAHNSGDFVAAEGVFAAMQKRFPDQPIAWLGLGRAFTAQSRMREAEALLREAVGKFPGFSLLATDLAALPQTQILAAPSPPMAAPPIKRDGPITLAVTGFHLANQITQILAFLPPLQDKMRVERLDVGASVDTIRAGLPDGWLGGVDVYFEESLVGSAQVKQALRSMLPAHCQIRRFPTSAVRSTWPFHGRDERLLPEPPVYNGGRYSHSDMIAASLAGTQMTDDALFDAYMELTQAAPLDLDAIYTTDLERWRREDAACDVHLADFLDARFREEYLFTTPNERGTPIVREIARQLLQTPVLAEIPGLPAALERLLMGWRASKHALPVHPRVARHFGFRWWTPDLRYRMVGNEFTFRDYIIRYIRWSPWLP